MAITSPCTRRVVFALWKRRVQLLQKAARLAIRSIEFVSPAGSAPDLSAHKSQGAFPTSFLPCFRRASRSSAVSRTRSGSAWSSTRQSWSSHCMCISSRTWVLSHYQTLLGCCRCGWPVPRHCIGVRFISRLFKQRYLSGPRIFISDRCSACYHPVSRSVPRHLEELDASGQEVEWRHRPDQLQQRWRVWVRFGTIHPDLLMFSIFIFRILFVRLFTPISLFVVAMLQLKFFHEPWMAMLRRSAQPPDPAAGPAREQAGTFCSYLIRVYTSAAAHSVADIDWIARRIDISDTRLKYKPCLRYG